MQSVSLRPVLNEMWNENLDRLREEMRNQIDLVVTLTDLLNTLVQEERISEIDDIYIKLDNAIGLLRATQNSMRAFFPEDVDENFVEGETENVADDGLAVA